ncbi:MAG: hypothetical protein K5666_00630 [Bacilli bacterium]|nr:hypothetical protein [Bacilli bacterium]
MGLLQIIDKSKKKLLISKVDTLCENATNEGRFSLFMCEDFQKKLHDKTVPYKSIKYIFDIVSDNDMNCTLPYDIGIFLNQFSQNDEIVVGVHRTRLPLDEDNNSEVLTKIMEEGFVNNGHTNAVGGSAFIQGVPPLSLAFTPLVGLTGFFNLINNYNNNNVIILACFPKNMVDKDLSVKDENVYYTEDGKYIVKPEYLIGALVKNGDKLDIFISRDEITKIDYVQ